MGVRMSRSVLRRTSNLDKLWQVIKGTQGEQGKTRRRTRSGGTVNSAFASHHGSVSLLSLPLNTLCAPRGDDERMQTGNKMPWHEQPGQHGRGGHGKSQQQQVMDICGGRGTRGGHGQAYERQTRCWLFFFLSSSGGCLGAYDGCRRAARAHERAQQAIIPGRRLQAGSCGVGREKPRYTLEHPRHTEQVVDVHDAARDCMVLDQRLVAAILA